ncbi:AAA family ATPase (plasmid) [Hymenobacter sp. 5317J-9]|uniref:AAA family ATPase n=1 Tax=Hymenobacter sp. 5317J-9 TaxID=2932250 RepID=UPI001FD659CA|nr:AAA family ATPase [Hymenobacter sp. 5317J-9]UOR00182.1 AAA family ATPase [Hymenobacter sp. 5317J-9]
MSYPMHIRLAKLTLVFTAATEELPFEDVTYFYGQMGAGKSSIARLIDYCLGGKFDLSPALQSEFTTATLSLFVNEKPLALERQRDSEYVVCSWRDEQGNFDLILPARKAGTGGPLIPGTEVEVLSDLLFYLAGIRPPRVRRSKLKEDSELSRLSLRDLLWFCYLDQDGFDSNFFQLDGGDPFKRLKSLDVLRFILGFHQEQVAELESELQELYARRQQLQGAAKSLKESLIEADVASEEEIQAKVGVFEAEAADVSQKLTDLRAQHLQIPHGTDSLRQKARALTEEMVALEEAEPQILRTIDQDRRHKNEILTLGLKVQRVAAARAVLGGVAFEACPRCTQTLPERPAHDCPVCGQEEPTEGGANLDPAVIASDSKARIGELDDSIARHEDQLARLRRRARELARDREAVDNSLTQLMRNYDSAYLSTALVLERRAAEIVQQINDLRRLVLLPRKVQELFRQADELQGQEITLRRRLEAARIGAEADMGNLHKLEAYFLDCLVRAQMPGVSVENTVKINTKTFLPEVTEASTGDVTVMSFANLSSGGKKTLFKACFALAIHRLATEVGAMLPSLLIIDSPMKNISERENKAQFEGFHALVYDLLEAELQGTQAILIDKEFIVRDETSPLAFSVRHMMPGSDENPPLIPYYKGL